MRTVQCIITVLVMIVSSATTATAQDPGWPRQRVVDGSTLLMYQPQVDDWKNFTDLSWRQAFSLTPKGGKQVVGVAVMTAQTQVDNDSKMVLLTNIKIMQTNFPSLEPAAAAQMDQMVRTFVPQVVTVSLQRLVACVPKKEAVSGVQLKNDPPMIFVSYRPAILLDVDGEPVRASTGKGNLEYVVNTHWRLFFEKSKSEYFLLVGDQWLKATRLQGPWSTTAKLPRDMKKLPEESQWADLKNVIPPPSAKSAIPMAEVDTRSSFSISGNTVMR